MTQASPSHLQTVADAAIEQVRHWVGRPSTTHIEMDTVVGSVERVDAAGHLRREADGGATITIKINGGGSLPCP